MYEEEDWVRLKVAKNHVVVPAGAVGWVFSTYVDGFNWVEVIFEREEKGEIQLLLEFSEIELVD